MESVGVVVALSGGGGGVKEKKRKKKKTPLLSQSEALVLLPLLHFPHSAFFFSRILPFPSFFFSG